MKKVLHIIDSVYFGGGAQEYLLEIFKHVEGVTHYCIALHGNENEYSDKLKRMIPGKYYVNSASPISYLCPRAWLNLLKLIRQIKPNLIHAHLFISFFFMCFLRLTRLVNTPFIVSIYALKAQNPCYENWGYRLLKMFPRMYVATASLVAKELIDSGIPSSQISIVGVSFNLDEMATAGVDIKREYGINEEKIIVRVARFHKDKGYDELVDILAILKNKYEMSFKAFLVGDGKERQRIEGRVKQLGLEKEIIFCGWKRNYIDYLIAADVVVCSSTAEGFGLANIAAIKYGRPFVCFSTGSLADMKLEGYRYAIADFSKEGFSLALYELLTDTHKRSNASQFVRSFYDKHFNSSPEIEKFNSIYEL